MMLSVLSQPSSLSSADSLQPRLEVNELGNFNDAIAFFTKLTQRSGKGAVKLYCTIPTWSSATDACLDLHDLHDLKSRALVFIHDLLQSLRSSGVSASYCLAPSSSSICLVSQKAITFDILQKAQQYSGNVKRGKVALVDIDGVPCLLIA